MFYWATNTKHATFPLGKQQGELAPKPPFLCAGPRPDLDGTDPAGSSVIRSAPQWIHFLGCNSGS
jgi:hypothetical protein